MADVYGSMTALFRNEIEGVDYRVNKHDSGNDRLVMAPHGGWIEPATSEIAGAIAGGDWSLFSFEGLKPGRPHRELHVTSEHYDAPQALDMVAKAWRVVAVHGRKDVQDEEFDGETTWVGGRDEIRAKGVLTALEVAGFAAIIAAHRLTGRAEGNICNRGPSKKGVQLEIPKSLRDRLVTDGDLMARYAAAVRLGSA